MLAWWTIGRATGVGLTAGLVCLVLWPFAAALALAGLSGASILLITAGDMLLRKRGESLRPVRAFDIAVGTALAVPSVIELAALSEHFHG